MNRNGNSINGWWINEVIFARIKNQSGRINREGGILGGVQLYKARKYYLLLWACGFLFNLTKYFDMKFSIQQSCLNV